ncbi:agouti-signaling protein 2b [Takifugu flavidus]|uniref:Agouti domain-containing protein n=1 Tax=Takifugu flavidus TaxID=433684 RepID=A0A5C6P269_9TELE|nr:agouti-signaling protein 2b [Takifugu flavidus]XP_056913469.1 agouti-signaling protein 2b [Takifugu flavidus]TWW72841.1 hypothetical protein D4764_15G0002350 [Takifugu flavidus]
MRKATGKHVLCFLLLFFPLSWEEDAKKDARKSDNKVCCQGKTRGLFARRKNYLPREKHILKNKLKVLTPIRRCSRLMESCSQYTPCCDPCASCHCRLFNTICNCWKMSSLCLRKT